MPSLLYCRSYTTYVSGGLHSSWPAVAVWSCLLACSNSSICWQHSPKSWRKLPGGDRTAEKQNCMTVVSHTACHHHPSGSLKDTHSFTHLCHCSDWVASLQKLSSIASYSNAERASSCYSVISVVDRGLGSGGQQKPAASGQADGRHRRLHATKLHP